MRLAMDYGQVRQGALAPLDAAAEYLRLRLPNLLPIYVLAMVPHAIAMAMLIDAISGEQRDLAHVYCIYLTIAMLWRWVWLAVLQRQVQRDLRVELGSVFWKRLGPIILVRLIGYVALTWGFLALIVPAFYGLYVGSFAAPLLLENSRPMGARLREAISWIRHSGRRLGRIVIAMLVLAVWLWVAIETVQYTLLDIILPSMAGMNSNELEITSSGWAWKLGVLYIVFLLLDFYWTVASVFIYYQSQSSRLGLDLRGQLTDLMEQPSL